MAPEPADAPAPVAWSEELPLAVLRGSVTMTTLVAGQLAVGERDRRAMLARATVGAIVTEAGALGMRLAQSVSSAENVDRATLDGMLMYGDRIAEQYALALLAAKGHR